MTKRTEPSILQNFDTEIAELIAKNRGISIMDALRIFLASKTHEMLENDEMNCGILVRWRFLICGKMKKQHGDPGNSLYLRGDEIE